MDPSDLHGMVRHIKMVEDQRLRQMKAEKARQLLELREAHDSRRALLSRALNQQLASIKGTPGNKELIKELREKFKLQSKVVGQQYRDRVQQVKEARVSTSSSSASSRRSSETGRPIHLKRVRTPPRAPSPPSTSSGGGPQRKRARAPSIDWSTQEIDIMH